MTDSGAGIVGGIVVLPLMIATFSFIYAALVAYQTGELWNRFTIGGLVLYGIYGSIVVLIAGFSKES